MFGKIKAVAIASLFAAALAAPAVAQADSYPPTGSQLLDSGSSSFSQGFESGPHESSRLYFEASFNGFGITPDVVHYFFVAHGVVVNDCSPTPVINGKASFEAQGFTGDLYVGLCDEGIVLPTRDKAYTWSVYNIPR